MKKEKLIPFLFIVTIALFSCKSDNDTDNEIVDHVTALNFIPANGYQQVKIENIQAPKELTFEAWVNFSGDNVNYPTILEFDNDAPFFGLDKESDGYHLTLYPNIIAPDIFPLNQWVHVAGSYSSANAESKLYINGVLVVSKTKVSLDISGVGAGIGYNRGDYVFNGSIDEVRIWNVIRTEAQIKANMHTAFTGNEAGLFAYYNLNDGKGSSIANDLTPNNNDGTLTNMDPATAWISFDSTK